MLPVINLPSVSTMTARYNLQEAICSRTSSFKWLRNTHSADGNETVNLVSQIFYLTQDGGVIICMSSLLKTAIYETTLYYGTQHSWFVPVLDYPLTNIERYRRFVSQ